MTLNDCVINYCETGECKLDLIKALKLFDVKCFISRYYNEYMLVRIRNKRSVALKIRIHEDDAKYLIKKLKLIEVRSATFRDASTFTIEEVKKAR